MLILERSSQKAIYRQQRQVWNISIIECSLSLALVGLLFHFLFVVFDFVFLQSFGCFQYFGHSEGPSL